MIKHIAKAAELAECLVAPMDAFAQSKDGDAFSAEGWSWGQNAHFNVYYGVVNDGGKVSVCGVDSIRATGRERTSNKKRSVRRFGFSSMGNPS